MPLPAIIPPLIAAAASIGGQTMANATNVRLSREQMRFQERMRGSAAQAAVEDYRRAGLNPALAYDRPASSPTGSLGHVENALDKGVSSALQAQHLGAQIKLLQAQTDKTQVEAESARFPLSLMNTTVGEEPSWRDAEIAKRRASLRDMSFTGTMQPFEGRLMEAKALLEEFLVPGARNRASVQRRIEKVLPSLKFVMTNPGLLAKMLSER